MDTTTTDHPKQITVPRIQYRQFPIEVGERSVPAEGESIKYPLTFSSETPVRKFSWSNWEEYDEVLSHDEADINMEAGENGLPMFKSHNKMMHHGSVVDIKRDGRAKKLKGNAVFSSIPLGREQETMLQEGHIRTVSVGYEVTSMKLIKTSKDGVPLYRCQWTPLEVSTEPLPGDPSVGFLDRAKAEQLVRSKEVDLVEIQVSGPQEGERTMEPDASRGQQPQQPTTPDPPAPQRAAEQPAQQPQQAVEVGRDRGAEAAQIIEMCQDNGLADRAPQWIREGKTPAEVGMEILKLLKTRSGGGQGQGTQPPAEVLEMNKRDRANYSMRRAIAMQVEIAEGSRHNFDGLEAEVHQELFKKRATDHGGILVPWKIVEGRTLGLRTLGTQEAASGSVLVGTQVMPDLIDLLRNRALILVAGARLYSNLVANLWFNKKTGEPTVYWMDENPPAEVTGSEPAYGYVSASPKTLMGSVQVPRQLIVQASMDVEADIRSDLAIGHALALDLAALHGKGTDKQPVGLYSAADVLSHPVDGVPDLEDVTTMPAMLAALNTDIGSLSWMTNPLMAGVLKRTPLVDGYPLFIWTGTFREGDIVGWTARATNQMSAALGDGADEVGMIFGNWTDLAVCMWGSSLEIVVDILTKAKFAQIVITSYSMGDIAILRPASFVKGTGAVLAAA